MTLLSVMPSPMLTARLGLRCSSPSARVARMTFQLKFGSSGSAESRSREARSLSAGINASIPAELDDSVPALQTSERPNWDRRILDRSRKNRLRLA